MICRYCKKEMTKDDVDFNFKGNCNIYWLCEHCNATCYEEVRFDKSYKRIWKRRISKR